MQKFTLFLLLTIVFNIQSFAQETAQDAFNEGVKLLKSNQFEACESAFQQAIENGQTEEGLKMAYIYKGFCQNGQGKYTDAIKAFDEAIKIDPSDPASYIDRGLAYSAIQDLENALADFNRVLAIDSVGQQGQAAYFYIGKINFLQGNFEASITYFDKLLALSPKDSESYFIRGTAKGNIMDTEGSIKDYDLAIKYNPNYMEAYTNRAFQKINALTVNGNIFPSKEETKSACEDFEKAMELGDQRYDLYDVHCTDMIERGKKKNEKKGGKGN